MPQSLNIGPTHQREPKKNTSGRAEGSGQIVDMQWITDRLALGGCVNTEEKMRAVAEAGVTDIINMAWESDESALAQRYGIRLCANAVLDDFQPKTHEILERGIQFAEGALRQEGTRLLIHCFSGRHRGPMMTLAVLGVLGWKLEEAMQRITERRPSVDWTPVYVESVQLFLEHRSREKCGVKLRPIVAAAGKEEHK